MKKKLVLLIALIPIGAFAQIGVIPIYNCLQNGVQAKTSGLYSSNYFQGIIPYCTVSIFLTGTTTIATTTPQSPFMANSDGSIFPVFAAVNQGYDVVFSGGIPPNEYLIPVTLTGLYSGFNFSGGAYLPLAGGTMTGAVNSTYSGNNSFTGSMSFGSGWNFSSFSSTAPISVGSLPYTLNGNAIVVGENLNGNLGMAIQNKSNGNYAAAIISVQNNLGTATTYYGLFGMNSSTYTGPGPGTWVSSLNEPNAVVLYSHDADTVIGTGTNNIIKFVCNYSAIDCVDFNADGGIVIPGNVTGGDEGAGTLNVAGLYVNGIAVPSRPVNNSISSATGGSNTGTVICITSNCTNLSGSYSVVGGTFTTGNLLVLIWPTTGTAYKCWSSQNGGVATYGIGHSVATVTGMTITAGISVTGVTVIIDYGCSPN